VSYYLLGHARDPETYRVGFYWLVILLYMPLKDALIGQKERALPRNRGYEQDLPYLHAEFANGGASGQDLFDTARTLYEVVRT
jgi:hypothetical protein